MLKVGYLGPEGTFSEEASTKYIEKVEKRGKLELIPYSTIHDILFAVNKGKIDEGIVPIENSVEGTVGLVLDILTRQVEVKIFQEIILPIKHYLMAAEKVRASQITDILSHPQAVAQCQNFLRKHIPQAEVHLTYSTADAAKEVAMGWEGEKIPHIVGLKQLKHYRHHFAAIGTRTAASMYKLNIISAGINDYPDNATRFIVVSQKNHPKTGRDKTSIVFSTQKNIPGALYEILAEFALRRINLTKIESRPSKKVLGDYFFYIDFEGHGSDWLVDEALKIIRRKTSFFKVLGSYPLAK